MALEPESARNWRKQAQFDYIGPFVKAWAAFNAWFREQSGEWQDARGIDYVCSQDNLVKNTACPLLRGNGGRASEFKNRIGALHECLEAYDLNKRDKEGNVSPIKLTSVCIRKWNGAPVRFESRGQHYQVIKQNGHWISTIRGPNGNETFRYEQPEWDLAVFEASARFRRLQGNKAPFMRQTYLRANPRPVVNLLEGDAELLQAGNVAFRCSAEDLFTGLVTTIYEMRNCLLHGELSPNERALSCYEPAFWIIRDILDFADA